MAAASPQIAAPQPPYLFNGVTPTALTVAWGGGGDLVPPTIYRVDWSLDEFSSSIGGSQNTTDTNATFDDLSFDTTYYFRGKAIGVNDESPYVPMGSQVTLATGAILGSLVVEANAITASWDRNNNPDHTNFHVEVSSTVNFLEVEQDTTTTAASVRMDGLEANTTYWVRIYSINGAGVATQPASLFSTPAVTLAETPVTPDGRGKWDSVGTLGNYILLTLSPADNNPSDTLYAIYNVDSDTYLTGDVDGGTAGAPTWLTSDDWRTRAQHAHLQARTEYHYRVQVQSRNGTLTPFSDVATVITAPAMPNVIPSVLNNDMALLDWTFTPAGAEEIKVYVSPTGNPNSYNTYYDTVLPTQPGIHYIEDTGDTPTLPGDVSEARHDTVGQPPAQVTTFNFVSSTINDMTFSWSPVSNPPPNSPYWYYLTGVSVLGEEGQPSAPVTIQVQPVIAAYQFVGTKNGNPYSISVATDPLQAVLTGFDPNTKLVLNARAISSDNQLAGDLSPSVTAWTLAAVPGQPAVSAGFDDTHKVFLTIVLSTSGNPDDTQYAIQLLQRGSEDDRSQSLWLEPKGGIESAKTWQTAGEWMNSPYTQVNLLANTSYYYRVIARNGDKNSGGPWIETAPSPEGSGITIAIPSPTNLRGVGVAKDAIQWTWKDNATDETGFHILALENGSLVVTASRGPSEPLQSDRPDGVSVTEFNLPAPNTQVVRTVVAYNTNGSSLQSQAATSYTLATDPNVESTNHQVNVVSNEIEFKFKDDLAFGPGTLAYYRVKFTTMTDYQFSGNETQWKDPAEIFESTRDIVASYTTWYLFVTSYNSQDTPSIETRYGPYPLFQDIVTPTVEELIQDGASAERGDRPVGERPLWEMPVNAVHDISTLADIPWAPQTGRIIMDVTKRLDPTSLTRANIIVSVVEDNNSLPVTTQPTLAYSISYNDSDQQLVITFTSALPPGYLYKLNLSGVMDLAGNHFDPGFDYMFRTYQDQASAHTYFILDQWLGGSATQLLSSQPTRCRQAARR